MAILRIHGNLVHFINTNKIFVKMNSEMHKVSYMSMLKKIYTYIIYLLVANCFEKLMCMLSKSICKSYMGPNPYE